MTDPAGKTDIIHDFHLRQPPARVWAALTDAVSMSKWLMPTDFQPILGHRFTFRRDPIPQIGFDGVAHCEVQVLQPPSRLEFSFVGGHLDTVVRFHLRAEGTGTHLHFEHAGFDLQDPVQAFSFKAMGSGWAGLGNKLDELAAS